MFTLLLKMLIQWIVKSILRTSIVLFVTKWICIFSKFMKVLLKSSCASSSVHKSRNVCNFMLNAIWYATICHIIPKLPVQFIYQRVPQHGACLSTLHSCHWLYSFKLLICLTCVYICITIKLIISSFKYLCERPWFCGVVLNWCIKTQSLILRCRYSDFYRLSEDFCINIHINKTVFLLSLFIDYAVILFF